MDEALVKLAKQRIDDARANVEFYKNKWTEAQSQLQKAEQDYQNLFPFLKKEGVE